MNNSGNLKIVADLFKNSDGATSFPSGNFQSILVAAVDADSEIYVDYIGTLQTLPAGTTYQTVMLDYTDSDEAKVILNYISPKPDASMTYAPYVAPFDLHYYDGSIGDWRGPAYSGYQAPWVWQDIGDSTGLAEDLQFLEDAQTAYTASTGLTGGFAPVYFWNRWDSLQYNDANTWGWLPAPDTDTSWGGFQYRTAENVAKTWANDPNNTVAENITMNFINFIETQWDSIGDFPTTFAEKATPVNDQVEPHMAALFLKCLVYAHIASTSSTDLLKIEGLINKTLTYISNTHHDISSTPFSLYEVEGTWSPDTTASQWYSFWGGEILDALGLLILLDAGTFDNSTDFLDIWLEQDYLNREEYLMWKHNWALLKTGLPQQAKQIETELTTKIAEIDSLIASNDLSEVQDARTSLLKTYSSLVGRLNDRDSAKYTTLEVEL